MASQNIVDAIVVSLGLDPKEYNEQIKKYREDRKRLGEENNEYYKSEERAQKQVTEGVRSLRNETAGFLLMLAGANSLQNFVGNMLSGDAATGRFAANIGLATEQVSVWEEAVKRAGGQAGDAQQALRAMASAFQSLQLTGTTGNDADFQGLGVSRADLQNPETALLRIAESSQRMPRAEFAARLQRLGLNDSTITLLARGRKGVTDLLGEVEALGVATEQDARNAQEFDAALAGVSQTIRGALRPAVQRLAEGLTELAKNQDLVNTAMYVGIGFLGALAVAAVVAHAPLVLLAGTIAVIAANWDKIKEIWNDDWFSVKSGGGSLGENLAKGWESFWNEPWFKMSQGKGGEESGPNPSLSGGLGGYVGAGSHRSGAGSAGRVENFFKSKGFSPAQARGIAASMVAENGTLDPSAHNRAGGGQGAYGLGQWRGSRLRALRAKYGQNPTFDQQLEFFLGEMHGPDGQNVASRIKQSGDSGLVAKMMVDQFYRPAKGGETWGDYRRAANYLKQPGSVGKAGGGSNSQTNNTSVGQVVIYTQATDAQGIARDLPAEMAKRGLVVQAGSGLRP